MIIMKTGTTIAHPILKTVNFYVTSARKTKDGQLVRGLWVSKMTGAAVSPDRMLIKFDEVPEWQVVDRTNLHG